MLGLGATASWAATSPIGLNGTWHWAGTSACSSPDTPDTLCKYDNIVVSGAEDTIMKITLANGSPPPEPGASSCYLPPGTWIGWLEPIAGRLGWYRSYALSYTPEKFPYKEGDRCNRTTGVGFSTEHWFITVECHGARACGPEVLNGKRKPRYNLEIEREDGSGFIGSYWSDKEYTASAKPTTPKKPAPAAPAKSDTVAPKVKAFASGGQRGTTIRLRYRVSDNSGVTREAVAIFRGKTRLKRWILKYGEAKGKLYHVNFRSPAGFVGSYTFCVQSQDRADNLSKISCAPLKIA